jgi:ABC-type antimicrobial peptide transport system permease subunit
MLRHNLLIIYRNIKRNKSTFLINILGLSSGLACVLLIFLWVSDELNMDKFNSKDSQLYQVMENQKQSKGIITQTWTPDLLADALAKEEPEVEYAVSVAPYSFFGTIPVSINDKKLKAVGQFAGRDFFNVFSYHLIYGDKNQVLSAKNSVVISKQLAMRLFNTTENVVGKSLEWQLLQSKNQAVITGIYEDAPQNSTEQFDFVLSSGAWIDICTSLNIPISWDNQNPDTYVILKKGTDIRQFNNKISGFIKSKLSYSNVTLFARPYSSAYLYNKYENGKQAGGRIEYVKLFSIIALFILLIACINFMNLSTAKASGRIKEVGIKKAVGVPRKALILQYMGESILMSFLSMILAVVLVELLIPEFNIITGKHLTLNFGTNIVLSFIGITLFTGIIAGSYPALYISGFNPAIILKGKLKNSIGEQWARKGLIIFQFSLSVIFIIAVLVVYNQMKFIQAKHLGYNKDNIIYFDKEGNITGHQQAFLSELKKIPGIVNASCISQKITGVYSSTYGVYWEGKNPKNMIQFKVLNVDYGMIETLGIEMKEGRAFSKKFGSDSSGIIFNEAAIKIMGLKDPIGKIVKVGKDMHVIGVTKDFNFESLHENIKPLFFVLDPERTLIIMAKITAWKERETINKVQGLYQAYNPGYSFDYKFLDEDFQTQYVAEQRVALLSRYFAGITIIISCLGLFGLAAFTAERRRKEIGIRKVLGSSDFRIIYLLSGDFTKLVIVAIVIALPVAYLITKYWLDSFAYRINLEPWYFITSGLAALLITWLTVGVQSVKAAITNPVKSLKYE